MSQVLFTNVQVFDATGEMPYPGEVLVEGDKIARVTKTRAGMRQMPVAGQTVIDGAGCFLMPGMVEAHTHFSWNNQPGLDAIQRMPPEARASALRMRLVEKAEAIIRESVKPMERIEGIKIMHVDGLAGGGNAGGDHSGTGGTGGFADGIVNSALRFRAQAPIVDQLLKEIGLQGGDIQRLVAGVAGTHASAAAPALPPDLKE